MRDFSNKVVAITGAGSGIGRALALKLAAEGSRLALSDVNIDTVSETASQCEAWGTSVLAYELDVADREAFKDHCSAVVEDFGSVNMLVNNAGVALGADILDMNWNDFDWLMGINFWGVANGTKIFLPHLIASGDGHIVNVSSVFGLMAIPSQSAYNAAKFAVRGFTEALRQEMRIGRHPVGVTCVHPGGIKTNIARNARGTDVMGDQEKIVERFDRIALTTPEHAATVILKGVRHNKPRVLIGPDALGFDLVTRLVGPRYQDINAPLARMGYSVARKAGLLHSQTS